MRVAILIRGVERGSIEVEFKKDALIEEKMQTVNRASEYLKHKFRLTLKLSNDWQTVLIIKSKEK